MDRRDGMSPPSSLQQQQQQQHQHHPQHQHHQQQQQQQQQHPFLVQQQRPIPPPQHHIHMASPPPGLHVPSVVRPTSGSMGSPVPSPGGAGTAGAGGGGAGGGGVGVGALVVHDGFVPQQLSSVVRPGEPVKRKRGRPRKYGDSGATSSGVGGSVSLALTPLSSVNPMASGTPTEKRRGRPPGSGKKQQLAALGSAGQGFTPHVITIAAGEDVATKIMSFSQTGPRAVCVLSANGAISNVTLRQPATSGGTVTYEGRFEILSLSGSFLLTESGGTRSRTGGLSVSLAGPDGRVVGGGVAGLLMAASPVQVVVGSFIAGSNKSVASRPLEGLASPPGSGGGGMQRPAKNESSGPSSPHMEQQGSGGSGSSLMHSHSQVQAMGSLQSLGWSSSQSLSEPRRDTDINIPLPNG